MIRHDLVLTVLCVLSILASASTVRREEMTGLRSQHELPSSTTFSSSSTSTSRQLPAQHGATPSFLKHPQMVNRFSKVQTRSLPQLKDYVQAKREAKVIDHSTRKRPLPPPGPRSRPPTDLPNTLPRNTVSFGDYLQLRQRHFIFDLPALYDPFHFDVTDNVDMRDQIIHLILDAFDGQMNVLEQHGRSKSMSGDPHGLSFPLSPSYCSSYMPFV